MFKNIILYTPQLYIYLTIMCCMYILPNLMVTQRTKYIYPTIIYTPQLCTVCICYPTQWSLKGLNIYTPQLCTVYVQICYPTQWSLKGLNIYNPQLCTPIAPLVTPPQLYIPHFILKNNQLWCYVSPRPFVRLPSRLDSQLV